jgi:hypothetical protein
MSRVRNAENALIKFEENVNRQLGQDGIRVGWRRSEYCYQTFILMVHHNNIEIEINLRFYPDTYAMTVRFPEGISDEGADRFTSTMKSKLDQCIYY